MKPVDGSYLPKIIAWCCLILPAAATAVPPDAETGRLLAAQCAQCHGTDGHSAGGIDSIAGESYGEIHNELKEMQTKTEIKLMHYQARGYTDEQIQAIALYLSSLPGGGGD